VPNQAGGEKKSKTAVETTTPDRGDAVKKNYEYTTGDIPRNTYSTQKRSLSMNRGTGRGSDHWNIIIAKTREIFTKFKNARILAKSKKLNLREV
jgi:hypothetical protein